MDTLNAIHDKMHKTVAAAGGRIDAIFYCRTCGRCHHCRKPKPGMFERIAACFNLDLTSVPAIGDSLARPAGCRILRRTADAGADRQGRKTLADGGLPEDTLVFKDLAAAVDDLLS